MSNAIVETASQRLGNAYATRTGRAQKALDPTLIMGLLQAFISLIQGCKKTEDVSPQALKGIARRRGGNALQRIRLRRRASAELRQLGYTNIDPDDALEAGYTAALNSTDDELEEFINVDTDGPVLNDS